MWRQNGYEEHVRYVFLYNEAFISWCTKKKPSLVLSFCEDEYIAGSFVSCQSIWLDSLFMELKCEVQNSMKLMMDNKSTINLIENQISHERSKHIETRFHFIREQVMKDMI